MKANLCNDIYIANHVNSGTHLFHNDIIKAKHQCSPMFTYCNAYYTKCISNMYLIIGVCNTKTAPDSDSIDIIRK